MRVFPLALPLLFAIGLPTSASAHEFEVPIDIGIGPSLFEVPEHIQEGAKPIWGVHIDAAAVIDHKTVERHKSEIPAQFRQALEHTDEIRVSKIYIPDSLIISPPQEQHGLAVYGVTWRPLAIGVPIVMGPLRLTLGTGLVGTFAHFDIGDYKIVDDNNGDNAKGGTEHYVDHVTNFLRPGADLRAELEIKFSDSFLTSLGFSSAYYVPQKIGGTIGEIGDHRDREIWRLRQSFLALHYRL